MGIIANAIVLVLGLLIAFPAMVLSILTAVFTLKQKQVENKYKIWYNIIKKRTRGGINKEIENDYSVLMWN